MISVDGGTGRVTFRVYMPNVDGVCLVGTFTGWEANPLRLGREGQSRTGWWAASVELPAGEHAFAYVPDGGAWMPDYAAHGLQREDTGRWVSTLVVAPLPRVKSLVRTTPRAGVVEGTGAVTGPGGGSASAASGLPTPGRGARAGLPTRESADVAFPGDGQPDGVNGAGATRGARSLQAEETFARIRRAIFGDASR